MNPTYLFQPYDVGLNYFVSKLYTYSNNLVVFLSETLIWKFCNEFGMVVNYGGKNRLAGATLMTPVINYWWHNLPSNLTTKFYYHQFTQDQWALRVAHYFPWLTFWWFTQKWFPSSSVVTHIKIWQSFPSP